MNFDHAYNFFMIPNGPTPLELLKHLPRIQKDPVGYLAWSANNYGDLVKYRAGTVDAFLVNHPDSARLILRDHHNQYNKDTIQYNALARVTGKGLLTNSGEHWLKQRRIIQPAFARQRLAVIEPYAIQACQSAIRRWMALPKENRVIDVDREMMYLSLEVLGLGLFGSDLGDQLKPLVEAVLVGLDYIRSGARNPLRLPTFFPTQRNRRFLNALKTLDEAVEGMLNRRKQLGLGDDLLSILIRAQEEQGKETLPDRQIRDEVVTLLIAGHETVATALTWSWYLLSQNPEQRQQLFSEVDSVLNGNAPGLDILQELTYTFNVFQEALRLYPPAWLITRKALQPDDLSGYTIPADALVIISPYTMHRHPDFWQLPERFDPNRFSAERFNHQHKFAYIPFGGGPALCIGKNFALIEAQIVLASLSQVFQFDLAKQEPVQMDALVTLRPRGGLHMRLTER